MAPRHLTAVALASALATAVLVSTTHAAWLHTRADCTGAIILVTWTLEADPGGYPDFVGYDLYRREQPECGPPVRLNAEIMPRTPGQTHTVAFRDTTAATATMYRYDVRLVDVNHQGIIWQEFCDPCFTYAWESCPRFSAPLVHGRLERWPGSWLEVWPCPNVECYTHFYIQMPWPPELEQYIGTGIAVRLYGPYGCADTEGCFMFGVVGFDVLPCAGTTAIQDPPAPGTWGIIKAMYR